MGLFTKPLSLTDRRLTLSHFKTREEMNSEIQRLQDELNSQLLNVQVTCHVTESNSSKTPLICRLTLTSDELDHLKRAIDIIFNENVYDVEILGDQVKLVAYDEPFTYQIRWLTKSVSLWSVMLLMTLMLSVYLISSRGISYYVSEIKALTFIMIIVTLVVWLILTLHHLYRKRKGLHD